MKRILIVEDDTDIALLLRDYLEMNGYSVETEEDGALGCKRALSEPYDLLMLDVMLPSMDGFEICRSVRREHDLPILMLSARSDDIDKIRALSLGADDYVVKPFSPGELVARIGAHLSRYERLTTSIASGDPPNRATMIFGALTVDTAARRVTVHGEEVILANREYELLEFLIINPNHVYSREALFERIWQMDALGDAATVTVHIGRLREKLALLNAEAAKRIETVRGAGYRFRK